MKYSHSQLPQRNSVFQAWLTPQMFGQSPKNTSKACNIVRLIVLHHVPGGWGFCAIVDHTILANRSHRTPHLPNHLFICILSCRGDILHMNRTKSIPVALRSNLQDRPQHLMRPKPSPFPGSVLEFLKLSESVCVVSQCNKLKVVIVPSRS